MKKEKRYNITYEGVALQVDSMGNIYTAQGKRLTQSPIKTNTAGNPYLTVNINGKNVLAHRICAFAFFGVPARGEVCHHRNGRKYDNKKSNIRWVSRRTNALCRHSHGECKLPNADDYLEYIDHNTRGYFGTWKLLADIHGWNYTNFRGWLKVYGKDLDGRSYHGVKFIKK